MILNSQRTIYGLDLELTRLAGKQYNVIDNTSLNEKFNVLTEEAVPENVYPTLKYFAIGVGEVDIIESNTGYSYSKHSPVDAALFKHIPFVMKPLDEDLLPSEQERYRFRKIETHNGINYACYYLRAIETFELKDDFYKVSTSEGLSGLSIFDTNTDILLNPIPKDRSRHVLDPDTAEYILKVMKIEFSLTNTEITDLREVLTLLQYTENNITEIGLCTGIDKVVDGSVEATCVQISHHVGVNIELAIYLNNNNSFLRSIELGGGEPMIL